MKAVLIETNKQKITDGKAFLNHSVEYIQGVYDEFKAIGVSLSLENLKDVLFWAKRGDRDALRKLVVEKIIEKAGMPNFNGVPINKAKLEELIDTPDISDIITRLSNNPIDTSFPNQYFRPELLIIENDVVKKKSDAFSIIEAENTFYTKNDKGAELATKLFELAEAFNAYAAYLNDKNSSNTFSPLISGESRSAKFKGLVYDNGVYRPDLYFIREMEASYPNFKA